VHVVQLSFSTIHPLSGRRKEEKVVEKKCCEGARNGRIRYYSDLLECTSLVYHSPPSTLFLMQRFKMSKSIAEIAAVTHLAMETTVDAIGTIGAKLTIIGGQIIVILSILHRDHVERNGTG